MHTWILSLHKQYHVCILEYLSSSTTTLHFTWNAVQQNFNRFWDGRNWQWRRDTWWGLGCKHVRSVGLHLALILQLRNGPGPEASVRRGTTMQRQTGRFFSFGVGINPTHKTTKQKCNVSWPEPLLFTSLFDWGRVPSCFRVACCGSASGSPNRLGDLIADKLSYFTESFRDDFTQFFFYFLWKFQR